MDGFYNWDVIAAAFFSQPDLFCNNFKRILFTECDFDRGLLCIEDTKNCSPGLFNTNFPTIKNSKFFENEVYRAWKSIKLPLDYPLLN